MPRTRWKRRSAEGWRALLARFASRGQTVRAWCQHESVSPASFYRWRSRLGPATDAGHIPVGRDNHLTAHSFVRQHARSS